MKQKAQASLLIGGLLALFLFFILLSLIVYAPFNFVDTREGSKAFYSEVSVSEYYSAQDSFYDCCKPVVITSRFERVIPPEPKELDSFYYVKDCCKPVVITSRFERVIPPEPKELDSFYYVGCCY